MKLIVLCFVLAAFLSVGELMDSYIIYFVLAKSRTSYDKALNLPVGEALKFGYSFYLRYFEV